MRSGSEASERAILISWLSEMLPLRSTQG